jgi:hypothetical protein
VKCVHLEFFLHLVEIHMYRFRSTGLCTKYTKRTVCISFWKKCKNTHSFLNFASFNVHTWVKFVEVMTLLIFFLFDTVRIWECSPVWTDFDKCHNLSKRNVKLILKILSDLEPLRGSLNKKKTLYSTHSCVNWAFFGTRGPLKCSFHLRLIMAHLWEKRPNLHTNSLNKVLFSNGKLRFPLDYLIEFIFMDDKNLVLHKKNKRIYKERNKLHFNKNKWNNTLKQEFTLKTVCVI